MTQSQLTSGWLVWSNEHGAWWGPNHRGYFCDVNSAGRYDFAAAKTICDRADYRDVQGENYRNRTPPEVMVPSPELVAEIVAQEPRP